MFSVVAHVHTDLTTHEQMKAGKLLSLTESEALARRLVRDSEPSTRTTAYDNDTGRTIAGPGYKGVDNGKTAKRRATPKSTPADRNRRRYEALEFQQKARNERRNKFIANRPKKTDIPKKK